VHRYPPFSQSIISDFHIQLVGLPFSHLGIKMPTPIKVGFIGYGGSTKTYHLPYLLPHPELEVYAFFQRAEAPPDPKSQKAGSHCTVDFPTAKHYRTSEEFFADKDIELVIICTHTDTHSKFAEQALKNSKHGKGE
jgi:predicted dehydrogenase